MPDRRKQQLAYWIGSQLAIAQPELNIVSGDASFRRYFRFQYQHQSFIAVDAPPEHENNQAFVHIAELLAHHQIPVPEVLQVDFAQGFLLLGDLGDRQLLAELNAGNVDSFYQQAINMLLKIQQVPAAQLTRLPHYDSEKLAFELDLFNQWFIEQHLKLQLSAAEQKIISNTFEMLIDSACGQQQVMVHRDFHSRNLMIIENPQRLAVIDFQDAVIGPISYDLVSLLKDCYIAWPQPRLDQWLESYYKQATSLGLINDSLAMFRRQFDWMGMQRHIKVLGIFARLNYRDHKPGYLKDLPLTFNYLLMTAARYSEFDEFHQLLLQTIQPAMDVTL